LRLGTTRNGIEDYEFFALLKAECQRLQESHPAPVVRGPALLQQVNELAWRTPADEIIVVVNGDASAYNRLRQEVGDLLEVMARLPGG